MAGSERQPRTRIDQAVTRFICDMALIGIKCNSSSVESRRGKFVGIVTLGSGERYEISLVGGVPVPQLQRVMRRPFDPKSFKYDQPTFYGPDNGPTDLPTRGNNLGGPVMRKR